MHIRKPAEVLINLPTPSFNQFNRQAVGEAKPSYTTDKLDI